MADANPLVAQAPAEGTGFNQGTGDNGWATGISIAESAMDTFNGFSEGNWIEGGLGLVGLAADAASMAIDPFGTLMSSAASFLMEHVQPLKDMLDWLAGDPPVIESYSTTWNNVATELGKVGEDYNAALKSGTEGWTGAAAEAYRQSGAAQSDALSGAASAAGSVGTVVGIMGMVVAFVREMVRDLIADLVAKLITWVLEAVFSLGFGTPVIVAQAIAAISKWATKIAKLVQKLLDTIKKVSPMLKRLVEIFEKIMKVLGKIAGKVTGLDVLGKKIDDPGFLKKLNKNDPDLPSGRGSSDGSDSDSPDSSGDGSDSSTDPNSPDQPTSRPNDSTTTSSTTTPDTADPGAPRPGRGDPSSPRPGDGETRGGPRTDPDGAPSGTPQQGNGTPRPGNTSPAPGTGDSSPSTRSNPNSPGGAPSNPTHSPSGGPSPSPSTHGPSGGPSPSPGTHGPSGGPSPSPSSSPSGQTHSSSTAPPEAPHRPDQPHANPNGRDTNPSTTAPQGQPSTGAPHGSGGGPQGGPPNAGGSRPGGGGGWTGTSGHRGDLASGVPNARTPDAPGTSRPQSAAPSAGTPHQSTPNTSPGGFGPQGTRGGPPQAGPPHTGLPHAGPPHSGPPQARPPQAGPPHAGPPQARPPHAGPPHAGPPHAGPPQPRPHTGPPNAGPPHAGPPHQGVPQPRGPQAGPPHPGAPHSRPEAAPPGGRPNGHPDGPAPHDRGGPPPQRDHDPSGPRDRTDGGPPHRDPDGDQPHDRTDSDPGHHDGQPEPRPSIDEAHARHGETTPAGISHHRGDPDMGDLPQRVPNDPRYFTADVHITPDGRARIGNHTYSPEEYGDLLRRNGWDGKTPIRLIGCDAGGNDFAKRLSAHTDAPVLAPTKPAWTDSKGRVFTSDAEVDANGNRQPRIPPNGEWETHSPDGTKTKSSEDGFVPGTHDKDKGDLDPATAKDRAADAEPVDKKIDKDHPEAPLKSRAFGRDADGNPVKLDANTRYEVTDKAGRDRGVFITDKDGFVKEVHTTSGKSRDWRPDSRQPFPNCDYHIKGAGGSEYRFHTDSASRTDHAEGTLVHSGSDDHRRSPDQAPVGHEGRDQYRDHNNQVIADFEAQHGRPPEPHEVKLYDDVGWDGGHLFGTQFDGPGEYINMVPMLETLNRHQGGSHFTRNYRALEDEFLSILKSSTPPPKLSVSISMSYPPGDVAPNRISVAYSVDGVAKPKLTYRNVPPRLR